MLRTRFAQLTRLAIEVLESRLTPSAHTWTGATSNLWSDSSNWVGGSPTASEQNVALTFPAGAANRMNTNDIPGLTIGSILFSADGYSISGSAIMLAGGITADAGVTTMDVFNLDTALSAAQAWKVTNASAMLTVGGVVSSPATPVLTVAGAGTLVLSGNSTYTGEVEVVAGTLRVNGSLPGEVIVGFGGTLAGSGTVGSIISRGTLSPGGPGPGILKSGSVDLGLGTFHVELDGTTAGTGYSQLNVNGRLYLSDSVLDGTVGFASSVGDTFTIITGTINTNPVFSTFGTFAFLPDNASLVLSGQSFRIHYYPTSVVLTRTEGVPISVVPTLTGLSTTVVPEGSSATTLTVNGANFMPSSIVRLNGVPLTTTFVSSTQLQTTIPASVLLDEAHFAVTVFNPGLGGGTSNGLTLNVSEAVLPDGTRGTINERVVNELYTELLGRPADAGGLAVHTLLLNQTGSVTSLATVLTRSGEYQIDLIQELYRQYLHRAAESAEQTAGVQFLSRFMTVEQLAESLVGSQEYFQARGGGTNDGFLKALYQDVFKRDIDPSGQSTFGQALAAGITRATVAGVIFSSDEYRSSLVQSYYQRFLDRSADAAGLGDWVAFLKNHSDAEVITGIVGSVEYYNKIAS